MFVIRYSNKSTSKKYFSSKISFLFFFSGDTILYSTMNLNTAFLSSSKHYSLDYR